MKQEAAVVAQLMGVEMFTRTSGRAAATVGTSTTPATPATH